MREVNRTPYTEGNSIYIPRAANSLGDKSEDFENFSDFNCASSLISFTREIRENVEFLRPLKWEKSYKLYSKHLGDLDSRLDSDSDFLKKAERFLGRVKETHLRVQIRRHLSRIIMFRRITECTEFNLVNYLKCSLNFGPLSAERLKKVRQFSTIYSLGEIILKPTKEAIKELKGSPMNELVPFIEKRVGYDYYLHQQFLVHFEEESDDFFTVFEKKHGECEAVGFFKACCIEVLEEYKLQEIKEPEEHEYFSWLTDAGAFDDDAMKNRPQKKQVREKLERGENPLQDTVDFRFKRTIVNVDPGNTRDAWSCNLSTLVSIKKVSYCLRQILEPIESTTMSSPYKAQSRYRKILGTKGDFVMVDIKKCGLSLPHELITIIGECIEQVYGPSRAVELIKAFKNSKVYDGVFLRTPLRGTGLGNFNEGTSLIQVVIGRMILKQSDGKIRGIFFNDDGAFKTAVNYKSAVETIKGAYDSVGIELQMKKTIISKSNVYCEDYIISEDNELDFTKRQLRRVKCIELLFKKEKFEMKQAAYSSDRQFVGSGELSSWRRFLHQFTRHFIEFHVTEEYWPFLLGGWYDNSESNFNSTMIELFDPSTDPIVRGLQPMLRKWSCRLIESEPLNKRLPLKYRKELHFKEPFLLSLEDESLFPMLGILTVERLDEIYNSALNARGLHNARPRMKEIIAEKLSRSRRKTWELFRSERLENLPSLGRGSTSMISLINKLNDGTFGFINFGMPEFLVKENTEHFFKEEVSGMVFVKNNNSNDKQSLEDRMKFKESIVGHYWEASSGYFSVQKKVSKFKESYLVREGGLIIPGTFDRIPGYYRSLAKSPKLLLIEYCSRKRVYPYKFLPEFEDPDEKRIEDRFKDPITQLAKDESEINLWKKLCKKKKNREYLEILLNKISLHTHKDFAKFLGMVPGYLERCREVKREGKKKPPLDNVNIIYTDIHDTEELFDKEDLLDLLIDFEVEEELNFGDYNENTENEIFDEIEDDEELLYYADQKSITELSRLRSNVGEV